MAKKKQKEEIDISLVNHTATSWCIEQGYKVYPLPQPKCKGRKDCNEYKIVVERAGKKRIGVKTYSHIESQNTIWRIFNELYKKSIK